MQLYMARLLSTALRGEADVDLGVIERREG